MEEREVIQNAPQEFLLAMGQLIFDFSSLELLASEIITAKYRNAVGNRSAWAQSGEQFISDLRKCFPAKAEFVAICDRLEDLYRTRNFYVHSDWMFYNDGSAALMNRRHRKNTSHPVAFDVNPRVTVEDLQALIQEINPLKIALEPYVHLAMGPWNEC